MNKTILALAITSTLGACSGPQKVMTPGGTNRVPINTEAALAKLSAESAKQASEEADSQRKDASREALEATVANLQKQVNDLKTYIILKATETDINTPKGVPTPKAKGIEPATKSTEKLPKTGKTSSQTLKPITIEDNTISFTVNHGFAKTAFNIPDDIRQDLVSAAKASQSIDIRGRPDALKDNPADHAIAYKRARHAYNFLVLQGVPRERIKVTFKSAGHFATENESAEGKANNRRVEIVAVGLDTTPFRKGS